MRHFLFFIVLDALSLGHRLQFVVPFLSLYRVTFIGMGRKFVHPRKWSAYDGKIANIEKLTYKIHTMCSVRSMFSMENRSDSFR